MGAFCEVYIADRKRALQYNFVGECKCKSRRDCECWDEYDSQTYDHLQSQRVYDTNLAQLLSVLRGKKHSESVVKEFKLLKQSSENGPWIQKVPNDLPKLLAATPADELKAISKAWAALFQEGYAAYYPIKKLTTSNTAPFLRYLKSLQKLCKKSIKNKQGMYLWTCL
ncbi:MAG TPA: hypothetical protein V6D22_03190 [Candidatus Obscuribacterales bacterium]